MKHRHLYLGLVGIVLATVAITARADEEKEKKSEKNVSPEALKILEQSVEAVKKVNFARYNAEFTSTAWIRARVPDVKGKAAIGEMSKYDVPRFRCDVELTPPAKPDAEEKPKTQRLTAGSDGDNYYLIDSEEKIVYVDMDPAVLGSNGGGIPRLLMRVLVDKEPFADELKADTIEKRDDAKVGSVPCYHIYVKSDEGEANWFISKSDLLPRRVERIYKNKDDEVGTIDLRISDLEYSSKMDLEPFRVTVPDGFKKTDEFAP